MHELALAESVVDAVIERTGDRHVSVVRLRVGRLAGVVPDALSFCFDLAAAGTPLAGASLEIVEQAGRAHLPGQGEPVGDVAGVDQRGDRVRGAQVQVPRVHPVDAHRAIEHESGRAG